MPAACYWKLHFAGDTGYGPIFPELGRIGHSFDVAVLPIGASPQPLARAVPVNPEKAVQIALDLGARRVVAMH